MALAVAFAFVAACGFGSGIVFIRIGTRRVSPPTATFMTVLSGAILITALAVLLKPQDIKELQPINFTWFAVMAALAYPAARVLMNTAISWVGASRAAPWASLQPLFALALGMAFLGERPNLLVGLGTPLIVFGLILVVLAGSTGRQALSEGTLRNLGFILAAGGAMCFASRDVISRHVVGNITDPLVTASMALLLGCVMLLVLAGKDLAANLRSGNIRYLAICGLAGICQGIAVASLFQALSRAPVTVVSPINASSPLVTLLLVHLFLQRLELVTPRLIIGTVLSVAGVIIVVLGAVAY